MPTVDAVEGGQLDQALDLLLNSPPAQQEDALRRLFVERLDFEPAVGNVPIASGGRRELPPTATRIAAIGGIQTLLVALDATRLTAARPPAATVRAISKALEGQVGEHLLVVATEGGAAWHFIYPRTIGSRTALKRIVVERDRPGRTARERLARLYLARAEGKDARAAIEQAFDVEAVTKEFYKGYEALFHFIENEFAAQSEDRKWAHDYALQLLNRVMFLYFIDRKGWLEADFLGRFWLAYRRSGRPADTFFDDWLKVLFFEAFNNHFSNPSYMPEDIRHVLQMAPYLNGGLFQRNELDNLFTARVADDLWYRIMAFFNSYNFTIAESTPWDQEVAVDPEMIGKVYESLVNVSDSVDQRGEAGIFYTPRTEIDLMSRLALVDYLANHLGEPRKPLLYEAVFAVEDDEKEDADRRLREENLWPEFARLVREVTALDPACGSGSFLVGMMQVLNDLLIRADRELGEQQSPYERKKRIIERSLYGVDVMPWAVSVAELRLWLHLVVDSDIPLPERKLRPLLPSLAFKLRCGDSLVQEVGGVNMSHVHGRTELSPPIKGQITQLKGAKQRFFNNEHGHLEQPELERQELALFRDILGDRLHTLQNEIHEKQRRLETARRTEAERRAQVELAGMERAQAWQPSSEETQLAGEIAQLQADLAQATAARDALAPQNGVPFVWDIAFVEVFASDKDGFDIVAGNPPYVRQEQIADPHQPRENVTADSKRAYKAKLARAMYALYPRFFGYNAATGIASRKLNAKSDLYIYFYLAGLRLLNAKGSFCFITSNSWLDVGYGAGLQELLLKHGHVKMVLDNQLRRSFSQADVNTIIALLGPPDDADDRGLRRTARFVMFKVPFEQVLSPVIFEEIEEAGERRTTPEYRVHPISQQALFEDGGETPDDSEEPSSGHLIKPSGYSGNKWGGKHLRAPDIFFTILEKGKGKLVRLGTISDVLTVSWSRQGQNDTLMSSKSEGKPKVEITDVLKSPKDVMKVELRAADTRFFLKVEEWVRGQLVYAPILWVDIRGDRHICHRCLEQVAFTHNFHGVNPLDEQLTDSLCAVLNSTLNWLVIEVLGRRGLGGGAVRVLVNDLRLQFPVLGPSILSPSQSERLDKAFDHLARRDVESVFHELGISKPKRDYSNIRPEDVALHKVLPDRRELDAVVFEALGLTEEEQLEVYRAVVELVKDRLSKARSV